MTTHHFETIAHTINLSYTHAPNPNVITTLAVNLADDYEKICKRVGNPNFNRSKFLAIALA